MKPLAHALTALLAVLLISHGSGLTGLCLSQQRAECARSCCCSPSECPCEISGAVPTPSPALARFDAPTPCPLQVASGPVCSVALLATPAPAAAVEPPGCVVARYALTHAFLI